jgi:hypothetical protein
MTLRKSAAPPQFNGLRRTLDVYSGFNVQEQTNFASGALPAQSTIGWIRGSGLQAGIFPVGSNGPDGIAGNAAVGQPHLFMSAGTFRDQYCIYHPWPKLVRPTRAYFDPFAVWEVEAHILLNPPGAAPVDDQGLIFHCNSGVTGYGTGFMQGGALGNPGYAGFAINHGAAGVPTFQARKLVGGALSESAVIPGLVGPWVSPRVLRYKVQIISATPTADAQLIVQLDETTVLTRNFGAGNATMPNVTDTAQWLGAFRVFIRNANNAVAGNALCYTHWRVSAAPSLAALT